MELNNQVVQKAFIDRLVDRAVDGAKRDIKHMLDQDHKSDQFLSEEVKQARNFFRKLTTSEKDLVLTLVNTGINSAIFGSMVVIDNVTTKDILPGQKSDVALYVQVYENDQKQLANEVKDQYRINGNDLEFLHDCLPDG